MGVFQKKEYILKVDFEVSLQPGTPKSTCGPMLAISVHGHQVAGKTKFMENHILFFIYTPSKPNNIKN